MLEILPRAIGRSLRPTRSGPARLVLSELHADPRNGSIEVFSPAFRDGAPIPRRYTADGRGVSPPIQWRGVPDRSAAMLVIVEDMDAGAAAQGPVHAIVWGLPGIEGGLPEGALSNAVRARATGGRSFLCKRYRPPDPPRGQGAHRYAFEVLALDIAPHFDAEPGREAVLAAARGHAIGAGCLVGTYARG